MNRFAKLAKLARIVALCAAAMLPAAAAESDQYDIKDIWFEEKDGGYAVRADFNVGSRELLDKLLRGGYTARLNFDLRFVQRRDWVFDREVGDIAWQATVSYDNLLQRYSLVSGGAEQRFQTYDRLLERLRRLRAGASDDADYIKILRRDDVYLRARFYLDTRQLPRLVQIEFLFDGDINLDSGWITLPMEARE